MSDVLERLLEHSVILSNAFSILPGTPLVFGLLNAKQAVKDDALHHEIEKNQDGVYVPDGIIPMHQGGGLIQEGTDNIDINTETVDGKTLIF
jgi:hypothetical protein